MKYEFIESMKRRVDEIELIISSRAVSDVFEELNLRKEQHDLEFQILLAGDLFQQDVLNSQKEIVSA